MVDKTPISVAYGDGIGPEIMAATIKILDAAGAALEYDIIEVGEKVYEQGNSTGIPDAAWESLKRTKVLLKAPITTPQGGGYKSLNVTIRKTLGLYANVRPCLSLHPYVPTQFEDMDLVIVRENEEDLYTGIEYRQHKDVYQCLKLISRPGCERIVRYAFEYAKKNNRKKVTCFSKDNIMKMTDGLFHKVFEEISVEYPDIESEHWIVDIGTALIAAHPERFDVIVTENLYGDIISDVAALVAGSVGMAGSANVGDNFAMFEAIHGSAPDIAGQGIANPSGLLNGAIQLLVHVGQPAVAAKIQNAWLRALEDGAHTGDIYSEQHSRVKLGTDDFADAVIERLGQQPSTFPVADYKQQENTPIVCVDRDIETDDQRQLTGVDVFVNYVGKVDELAELLAAVHDHLTLKIISSMGIKVWPNAVSPARGQSFFRCRFESNSGCEHQHVVELLGELADKKIDFVKTEQLYHFDGVRGYTLAQGE